MGILFLRTKKNTTRKIWKGFKVMLGFACPQLEHHSAAVYSKQCTWPFKGSCPNVRSSPAIQSTTHCNWFNLKTHSAPRRRICMSGIYLGFGLDFGAWHAVDILNHEGLRTVLELDKIIKSLVHRHWWSLELFASHRSITVTTFWCSKEQ